MNFLHWVGARIYTQHHNFNRIVFLTLFSVRFSVGHQKIHTHKKTIEFVCRLNVQQQQHRFFDQSFDTVLAKGPRMTDSKSRNDTLHMEHISPPISMSAFALYCVLSGSVVDTFWFILCENPKSNVCTAHTHGRILATTRTHTHTHIQSTQTHKSTDHQRVRRKKIMKPICNYVSSQFYFLSLDHRRLQANRQGAFVNETKDTRTKFLHAMLNIANGKKKKYCRPNV